MVLDLTAPSHGNAIGIGLADFTTQRVIDQLNTQAMTTNAITAMTPEKARLPVSLATDRAAVEAALQTIGAVAPGEARIVHIKNTLEIGTFHVSQTLKNEMKKTDTLLLTADIGPLEFEADGRLPVIRL